MWTFPRATKLQLPGHCWPTGHRLHAPSLKDDSISCCLSGQRKSFFGHFDTGLPAALSNRLEEGPRLKHPCHRWKESCVFRVSDSFLLSPSKAFATVSWRTPTHVRHNGRRSKLSKWFLAGFAEAWFFEKLSKLSNSFNFTVDDPPLKRYIKNRVLVRFRRHHDAAWFSSSTPLRNERARRARTEIRKGENCDSTFVALPIKKRTGL